MLFQQHIRAVADLLQNARMSLMLPRKRSLAELQQFRPNKCFNPPLPPDLALSIYVSSSKLVCAAYHQLATPPAQPNQPIKSSFHVYQGEVQVK